LFQKDVTSQTAIQDAPAEAISAANTGFQRSKSCFCTYHSCVRRQAVISDVAAQQHQAAAIKSIATRAIEDTFTP
jgi:hypothetical protein